MAEYYFIGGDDKEYGPYSLEKMRKLYSQNRLNNKSKVKKDGGEFQSASNLEELTCSPPQTAPFPDPAPPQTPVSPSIPMTEYYFIGGDHKEYGPYNLEQMRELHSQKRLNNKSMVKKDGGGFQPASNFKELTSSLPQTPMSLAPSHSPQVTATPYAPGQAHISQQTQKPGKVQAISIMVLVMGIFATLGGLTLLLSTVCIYFVAIYGIVHGIMAIVKGSQLMGSDPWDAYQGVKTTAIMGIVNIINCDIWGMVCGIVILVFLGEPEVRAYMRLPQR